MNETDEKFIERVTNMVFNICGCDKERGIKVLKESLRRAEQ